jgi:hypothetical protein
VQTGVEAVALVNPSADWNRLPAGFAAVSVILQIGLKFRSPTGSLVRQMFCLHLFYCLACLMPNSHLYSKRQQDGCRRGTINTTPAEDEGAFTLRASAAKITTRFHDFGGVCEPRRTLILQ